MFTKHFNQTVLSIDFAGFRKQDEEFFERFCHLWFKMANNSGITAKESEHHLISTLKSNSVGLDEQSETISEKWLSLLKTDSLWEALLCQSPFKLSIQKVQSA